MPQLIAVSFQMIWMHVIFGFFATPDVLSFSVEHMKLIIIIKNPALREPRMNVPLIKAARVGLNFSKSNLHVWGITTNFNAYFHTGDLKLRKR